MLRSARLRRHRLAGGAGCLPEVADMASRCASLFACAALAVAVTPMPAAAQTLRTSVSATYTFLRDTNADQSYGAGVTGGFAHRIAGWLAVAADGGVSADTTDYTATGGDLWLHRYWSLHAGPRVARPAGRVRPYGECLFGVTWYRVRGTSLQPSDWTGVADFSLQPGGGVDVFLTPHVAFRAAADLQVLFRYDSRFDTGYRSYLYRVHAGVSFHVGRP
jgi:hypothetical protein